MVIGGGLVGLVVVIGGGLLVVSRLVVGPGGGLVTVVGGLIVAVVGDALEVEFSNIGHKGSERRCRILIACVLFVLCDMSCLCALVVLFVGQVYLPSLHLSMHLSQLSSTH